MEREGKKLRELPRGDRRRLSDGRNAWRKMSDAQRRHFLRFIASETGPPAEFALLIRCPAHDLDCRDTFCHHRQKADRDMILT